MLADDVFVALVQAPAWQRDGLCREPAYRSLGWVSGVSTGRCFADVELAGRDVPLDRGGWHDPGCDNPPRSAMGGLCDPCRARMLRWCDRTRQPRPSTGTTACVAVCRRCLARADCLAYALARPDLIGVWGGTTTSERDQLRRCDP